MKTLILHHVKNPDVDHGYWPGYAPSCPKSQNRTANRSRTLTGIGAAMAAQWSEYLLSK